MENLTQKTEGKKEKDIVGFVKGAISRMRWALSDALYHTLGFLYGYPEGTPENPEVRIHLGGYRHYKRRTIDGGFVVDYEYVSHGQRLRGE